MRLLAALAVAVVLWTPAMSPALPGPGVIRVTATQIRTIVREGDTMHVSLIYNRPAFRAAIGNAILSCDFVGRGGPLASGTQLCEAFYSLRKGRIVASGIIKERAFYVLAVTGGTGLYSNVKGELIVSTIAESPRQERLLFSLEV